MKNVIKNSWSTLQKAIKVRFVRQLLYVGIVVFSLVFIAYLAYLNWAQLKEQVWHFSAIHLIMAVVLYPLGMFPTIAGWHYLLRAFNNTKPFLINMRLYALSSLPKHIPGLVWYITSRTLLYEEHYVKVSVILAATAFETALLALSGFITAILFVIFQSRLPGEFGILRYLIPISIGILVSIIIWAPGGSLRIEKILNKLKIDTKNLQINRKDLWKSIGWMFLAWIGGGVLLWISVRSITDINYTLLPSMIGIWGVAGAVSLTIGLGIQGLGLRELTLGALLSLYINPIKAITVAIAFRLILTLGELLWVLLISILVKDKTDPDMKPVEIKPEQ